MNKRAHPIATAIGYDDLKKIGLRKETSREKVIGKNTRGGHSAHCITSPLNSGHLQIAGTISVGWYLRTFHRKYKI